MSDGSESKASRSKGSVVSGRDCWGMNNEVAWAVIDVMDIEA